MNITPEFKDQVITALLGQRENYSGSDAQFAKKWSLNSSVFNRLKNGERDRLISDTQYLNMGRQLNVSLTERKWNVARTDVFNQIEEDITFCKEFSKSMIFVDDCEIGKTFTAQYLSRSLKNCFYIDGSQAKTKQHFVRTLAKTLGVDDSGRYIDIKANIKYYLRMIERPVVIIDEFGDLEYTAFLELKEFWNGTEGVCGWYLLGADGARAKINRGIDNKKVGYREILSRFSGKYSSVVPTDRNEKINFYKKLITDVISVNTADRSVIPKIVNKCLVSFLSKDNGKVKGGEIKAEISGLRRAETLLILNS